jgi:hypothetical protein
MNITLYQWLEKENNIMPVLNQEFSNLDQEGDIENTNMVANW